MKRARDVREQLAALCERVEIDATCSSSDSDALGKAITAGFFYHAAKLQKNGGYRTVKNAHTVHIHPSSSLAKEVSAHLPCCFSSYFPSDAHSCCLLINKIIIAPSQEAPPRWVLFHELVETSKEFMRQVIAIKPEWLIAIAPHYYKAADIVDESTKKMPKGVGLGSSSGGVSN